MAASIRPVAHEQNCSIHEGIACYGCSCGLKWRQELWDVKLERDRLKLAFGLLEPKLARMEEALKKNTERIAELEKERGIPAP